MQQKLLLLSLAAAGLLTYWLFEGRTSDAAQASPPVPAVQVCSSGAVAGSPMRLARAETAPFTLESIPQPSRDEDASLPPLFDGLGSLGMRVSTDSVEAQAYFNQGLRLAFAFNHAEARRAFQAAQHFDADCGMCYWGEALVLGPNINAPMFPDAIEPAYEAVSRAVELADNAAAPVERALIEALAERYAADADADRDALDQAYAEAMREAAERFPEHDTLQTLYAESLMNLSPWDYWTDDGAQPKGHTEELVAVLESVLARDPEHPGAIHLYIHAVEASDAPERALPYAERLADLMPAAGHIVHMPSHIYYRVGMYREALEANIDAVAADERYFQQSESDPVYRNGYYPHNLHFLLAAAEMGGDGETAIEAAEKLDAVLDTEFLREAPSLQPVKAATYLAHGRFSPPEQVLALPAPDKEFALVVGLNHYVRAIAHARLEDFSAAQSEIESLKTLRDTADLSAIEASGVPATDVIETALRVAQARLADARGELGEAASHYREAVDIQDRLAYMEPPYWYYPVRQSLGSVLLRQGEHDEAGRVFSESLERVPGNGWVLYGQKRLYQAQGDAKRAESVAERFDEVWFGDADALTLDRL